MSAPRPLPQSIDEAMVALVRLNPTTHLSSTVVGQLRTAIADELDRARGWTDPRTPTVEFRGQVVEVGAKKGRHLIVISCDEDAVRAAGHLLYRESRFFARAP